MAHPLDDKGLPLFADDFEAAAFTNHSASPTPWLDQIKNDVHFKRVMETCNTLLNIKGADYAGPGDGSDKARLANFYRNAERLGLTPFQVLGVYANKHLDAIHSFIATGVVQSEPIESRIVDSINYLLLLYKLVCVERDDV